MMWKNLSYTETARQFDVSNHHLVASWERIYLEEGPEGLYIERRGRGSKGHPPKKLKPKVEEDLHRRNCPEGSLSWTVNASNQCFPWVNPANIGNGIYDQNESVDGSYSGVFNRLVLLSLFPRFLN